MTYTYTPGLTFSSGEDATSAKITDLLQNVVAIFPIGALVYFHQSPTTTETTLNGKWIQCNGTAISRTTYAALWAQFGSSDVYGGGDGSTTFGLPDLRGRYPISVATSGHADVNAFGKSDGVALASRRMKHAHTFANGSHSHTTSGTADTGGSHSHSGGGGQLYNSATGTTGGIDTDELTTTQGTAYTATSGGASHTHTVAGLSHGSNTAVSLVGVAGTPTDQQAFITAGCWYMAYV